MATIQNTRDLLLQATVPRIQPYILPANTTIPVAQVEGAVEIAPGVNLTAPVTMFRVNPGGTASPGSITVSAELVAISGSTSWAVVDGTATLTGSGTSRTVDYDDMATDSIRVRVEVTDGSLYFDEITIVKLFDGRRGSISFPSQVGSVWDDAVADALVLAVTGYPDRVVGDQLLITNFTTFAETRYWDGADWVLSTVIVDGSNVIDSTLPLLKLAPGPSATDADLLGYTSLHMGDQWNPNLAATTGWAVRANNSTVHAMGLLHTGGGIGLLAATSGVLSSKPAILAYGGYDALADTWTHIARMGSGAHALYLQAVGYTTLIMGDEDYAADMTHSGGTHVRLADDTYALRILDGTFRYGAVTIDEPPNSTAYLNGDGSWQSLGVDTGSATATLVLNNKPGTATSNSWLAIEIDGVDYVIPIWLRT